MNNYRFSSHEKLFILSAHEKDTLAWNKSYLREAGTEDIPMVHWGAKTWLVGTLATWVGWGQVISNIKTIRSNLFLEFLQAYRSGEYPRILVWNPSDWNGFWFNKLISFWSRNSKRVWCCDGKLNLQSQKKYLEHHAVLCLHESRDLGSCSGATYALKQIKNGIACSRFRIDKNTPNANTAVVQFFESYLYSEFGVQKRSDLPERQVG